MKNVTRGHQLKIKKTRPNGNLRQNFFSVRIENDWNSLPAELVNAQTINGFKNGLDVLWKNKLYCIQAALYMRPDSVKISSKKS